MDESPRLEKLAALAFATFVFVLRYAIASESWAYIALAFAIPIVFTVGVILGRDPRG